MMKINEFFAIVEGLAEDHNSGISERLPEHCRFEVSSAVGSRVQIGAAACLAHCTNWCSAESSDAIVQSD